MDAPMLKLVFGYGMVVMIDAVGRPAMTVITL